MESPDTLYVSTREEWRSWLEKNHDSCKQVWLLYYKKHTCRPRIPYDDAVEEALCFGWIDSIIKRVDEISYSQKFTPRRHRSHWSESNLNRAKDMIARGKMTEYGMKFYQEALDNPDLILESPDNSKDLDLPDVLKEGFKSNISGSDFFLSTSKSYRNMCIRRIIAAKKDETKKRRVKEIVDLSNKKQKLGLK